MILIDDIIISDEVVEKHFACNLKACKGGCCVEGDEGAPLEKKELKVLEEIYPTVKEFITEEGRVSIEEKGTWIKDKKGKLRVPLRKDGACAYVRYEKGIAKCGIEAAYEKGTVEFRKPISCHLYPVRVSTTEKMNFVNYEEWDICDPACELGRSLQVPLYEFVKEALVRKFGKEFYETLTASVKHINNQNAKK